jgi:hypothetical protein
MWAASKAALTRARISRSTSHCRNGAVFATIRIVISVLDTSCAPHTSGSSSMTARHAGSVHMVSAASRRMVLIVDRSAV